jgi:hypothetical protein
MCHSGQNSWIRLERGDVGAAVQVARQRGIAAGRIALWGQSYGGVSALLAAAHTPEVGAIIADSAFADVRMLMNQEMRSRTRVSSPIFTPGVTAMGRLMYGLDLRKIAPVAFVPRIAPRPILFIHGAADTRIPVRHAELLKAASTNPLDELWVVPEAGHVLSFALARAEYQARVLTFLRTHLAPVGD